MTERMERMKLRIAARNLIWLAEQCPELFIRVLPIGHVDMETLREIAELDDEDDDHAAD